jgi:2'-5' RNA ligase
MTGPRTRSWPGKDLPGRRLFVAVPLPPEAIAAIKALVDRVRSPGVPGGGRDVRWVRLDGLHVTLRFLGPTPDDRVDPTVEAIRRLAPQIAPFDVVFDGAGAFPEHGRPRALWVGIADGAEELARAAVVADAELVAAGWTSDTRPFRAHLTLARSDGVPAGREVATRLSEAATDLRLRVAVDRIGVFESLTGGGPARYEPVEVVALG